MAEIIKGFDKTNLRLLAYYKKSEETEIYNRAYFDGDSKVGYHPSGYANFPSNYTFASELLGLDPQSVIELGGGRGYIMRLLETRGVKTVCLDISEHCWYTRAIDSFNRGDATASHQYADKQFDISFSKDFLEHIPEHKLEPLIKEMARISKTGYHAITFSTHPNTFDDKTHRTLKTEDWWYNVFGKYAPGHKVTIIDKEKIEQQNHLPAILQFTQTGGMECVNIGSFTTMFYGMENWDIIDLSEYAKVYHHRFKQVDILKPFPKRDNSVDLINCSHVLEHFTREEGLCILKECHRVLKPGGVIRVAVPDAGKIVCSYYRGEIADYKHFNVDVEKAADNAESLFHLLIAGHKTCYDINAVVRILKGIFDNAKEVRFSESISKEMKRLVIDLYPDISSYIEAIKNEQTSSVVHDTPAVCTVSNYLNDRIKTGVVKCE